MFKDRRAQTLRGKRAKQPWPKGTPFKVLSLDGGGIRGVFAAHILRELEDRYGPIAEYFDLIAGTSTGGIIGLGLGLGVPAVEIEQFYLMDGAKVFPLSLFHHHLFRNVSFLRRLTSPSHDHQALESLLLSVFGQRTFGEAKSRMVIPAFLGPDPQISVFKTDHHPDYKRDWQTPAWKVARATSAAPTFFEAHDERDAFFLDGGLWANNPALCAAIEAVSAYQIDPSQIEILSIGTGSQAEKLNQKLIRSGLIGWRGAIKTAMFLTSDSHLSLTRLLVGYTNLVRIDPTKYGAPNIELDDWATAVEVLPSLADRVLEEEGEKIEDFFNSKVRERERHYTTAHTPHP
jgi:patatin-like phospholipase/acyl hydrolase